MRVDDLPLSVFQYIISFLERDWDIVIAIEEEGSSYNKEITNLISFLKHERIRKRLFKCLELWWRKIHYRRLLHQRPRSLVLFAKLVEVPYTVYLHHKVSELWEDRCWDLSEKRIHGEIEEGKWCDGEMAAFPHTVAGYWECYVWNRDSSGNWK